MSNSLISTFFCHRVELHSNSVYFQLYNEEIIDLLAADRKPAKPAKKIVIHEDPDTAEIFMTDVTSHVVRSAHDILKALKKGARNRTTAATNMNATSSRSHAIFTVSIRQQRMVYAEVRSGSMRRTAKSLCMRRKHDESVGGASR